MQFTKECFECTVLSLCTFFSIIERYPCASVERWTNGSASTAQRRTMVTRVARNALYDTAMRSNRINQYRKRHSHDKRG